MGCFHFKHRATALDTRADTAESVDVTVRTAVLSGRVLYQCDLAKAVLVHFPGEKSAVLFQPTPCTSVSSIRD